MDAHTERPRQRARVVLGSRGGVGGRHDRHAHPLGAERVRGEAADQRRVNPTGEAEHHVGESVLAHVVAQAEAQRGVDLGLRWGNWRRQRSRWRLGGGSGEIELAHKHVLLELRGASDRRAGGVEHEGVTVEDELVLTADQRAEGDVRAVLASALRKQTLALQALAGVVGGGGDVEDQPRSRRDLFCRRSARPPQVLADRQPDGLPPDVDHRARVSGHEVALLVEDAVVGEMHLAVDRAHAAVGEHRGGVVHARGLRGAEELLALLFIRPRFGLRTRRALCRAHPLGVPDHGDDPLHAGRQLLQRSGGVLQEVLAQQ